MPNGWTEPPRWLLNAIASASCGMTKDAPELPIVERGGRAWVVVWPGLDAHLRSIHHISLGPGGRTVQLEHPMESVYYVKSGGATASDNSFDRRLDLSTGAMAHIGQPTRGTYSRRVRTAPS